MGKDADCYDVSREQWRKRKLSEENKKVSKVVLEELDEFDDNEGLEDSDPKRIPTYERRRYAGTEQKLGKYGYFCVLPATDEEDAVIWKITASQRRPLRAPSSTPTTA